MPFKMCEMPFKMLEIILFPEKKYFKTYVYMLYLPYLTFPVTRDTLILYLASVSKFMKAVLAFFGSAEISVKLQNI